MLFLLAGRAVRSRSRLTAELHEAAVRADEAREVEAERAVADERRRIAREMHDVVAHSVSMMVVQAGGARRILERDPARAVAAAELIERTGREALAEMRALLGVLHAEEHAEYAPQPTLRELDALVERARSAGVPVEVAVEGERRELPAGLDLAAYRVVQEALTNVVKHAGGAPTEVSVHYRADAVEVRIADRGERQRPRRAWAAAATASSACASACACTAASCTPAAGAAAASRCSVRLPLEGEEDAALTAGARHEHSSRVLIADDQALVRAGFKMILDAEDDLDVVGEAADGAEAVELARRLEARRRADGHPHAASSTGSRRRGAWSRSTATRPCAC